jgi:hypothetical protein
MIDNIIDFLVKNQRKFLVKESLAIIFIDKKYS